MEFLQACAARLDAGEAADTVLEDMRARYTTLRCLNVKTCLVRRLCTATPEYRAALRGALENAAVASEDLDAAVEADDLRALDGAARAALPPRLTANAAALRLPRAEVRQCKRLAARSALEKNRKRVRVDGRALLCEARAVVDDCERRPTPVLAMALMLLLGRRTCELLNGRSRFERVGPHTLVFGGQAKRRGAAGAYRIPVLHDADALLAGVAALRRACRHAELDNRGTSRRYQSWLSRALAGDPVWAQCGRIHALRGLYACMCVRLFDWDEDYSEAFLAMSVLGHTGLGESLVYTPFNLGDDFASEPRLGPATLDVQQEDSHPTCVPEGGDGEDGW